LIEKIGTIFKGEELRLALYPNPNQTFWNFDAEDAANAIREAKEKLLETRADDEMRFPEAA